MERLLACLALICLVFPFLLIALIIHVESGSPVLVTDELPGRDDADARRFHRFRTTGPGSAIFKVTSGLLRAYGIDKLPAIWSVLKGDISLGDLSRLS